MENGHKVTGSQVTSGTSQGRSDVQSLAALSVRGMTWFEYVIVMIAVAIGIAAMQRMIAGAVGGMGRGAADVFGSGLQEDREFIGD